MGNEHQRGLTEAKLAYMQALREQGMSDAKIARVLNVSASTIWRYNRWGYSQVWNGRGTNRPGGSATEATARRARYAARKQAAATNLRARGSSSDAQAGTSGHGRA